MCLSLNTNVTYLGYTGGSYIHSDILLAWNTCIIFFCTKLLVFRRKLFFFSIHKRRETKQRSNNAKETKDRDVFVHVLLFISIHLVVEDKSLAESVQV